jgi:hypothetical protein
MVGRPEAVVVWSRSRGGTSSKRSTQRNDDGWTQV